jgi:polyribonucleotide nucleotidyltransferase
MHHHSSKNGIRFVVTRDGSSLSRWLSKVQPKHETNRPFSNTTIRRFLAGNAPRRRTLIPLDRLRFPFQNNMLFMNHQYCRFQMRRCLSSSSVVEVGNEEQVEAHFRSGPSLRLGTGRLANQTHAAVIGTAGSTVVLATVARDDIHSSSSFSGADNDQNQYQESVLTVEFKQKAAGVGEIPMGRLRNDPLRMSSEETLACRAIDRSLRPLMRTRDYRDGKPYHFHVHCTVQAVDIWGSTSGHPISTTLNAAAAALGNDALTEPVAATTIAVLSNGNYVQDPGPEIRMSDECIGELLYAGTRSKAIMIEWTSVQRPLPESQWGILLELAAASIQPYLDTIEEMWEIQLQKLTEKINEVDDLIQIRQSLGLDESSSLDSEDATERLMKSREEYQKQQEKLAGAIEYCQERLASPLQRLFGGHTRKIVRDDILDRAYLHKTPEDMPTKSFRGRREQVMQEEIYRLVQNYLDSIEPKTETSNGETNQKQESTGETTDIENEATNKEQERNWICQQTLYRLLNRALWEVSVEQGVRSDNRRGAKLGQGWKTIRPVNATVPALPMAVHGSALFTRGDTQVLCTVTLGAPRDGKPRSDPYQPTNNPREIPEAEKREANGEGTPYESLPVGSLRFLRTQEALESDLNSRKSKADKERTGDSGSLAEFKRAFLQYEFPSYSTGELPAKGGKQRRSIGHGALAERAILPVLPDQADFPYAIRITSEVTDSNGSSSMASVCGATLALLDAGVPLKAPAAAVSVGIAIKNDSDDSDLMKDDYSLLLDITGTEDHVSMRLLKIHHFAPC